MEVKQSSDFFLDNVRSYPKNYKFFLIFTSAVQKWFSKHRCRCHETQLFAVENIFDRLTPLAVTTRECFITYIYP